MLQSSIFQTDFACIPLTFASIIVVSFWTDMQRQKKKCERDEERNVREREREREREARCL